AVSGVRGRWRVHRHGRDLANGLALEFTGAGKECVGHGYDSTEFAHALERGTHGYSLAMALQIPPNCDLTLGLTCVEKGADATTVWRMRVDERFLNPAGIVQGGFL